LTAPDGADRSAWPNCVADGQPKQMPNRLSRSLIAMTHMMIAWS
jgi:hypothetical protein